MIDFFTQSYHLQVWVVVAGLLVGMLAHVFVSPLKYVVTIVHEFGHALVARLTFGKVYRMRINHDSSGSTEVKTGVSGFFATLSGYPMPFLLALLLSFLIKWGRPQLTFVFLILIGFYILFHLRNAWGFFSVIVVMLVSVLAILYATAFVNFALTAFLIMILVMGGMKDIFVLFLHYHGVSDADILSQQLRGFHAMIWKIFFFLVACFITLEIIRIFWELLV
ncbi:M50 family metallopeptidase [Lactococcus nasutitermitis]|uniref:M50 family metallopeptidase n=1 Tax=Lactococcus nasutitermitis TaxID=1652957 RepID=A0ABV9J978_9LACT|nr:M50 family metallopeptidase [Lactococcus nasutitermitis]